LGCGVRDLGFGVWVICGGAQRKVKRDLQLAKRDLQLAKRDLQLAKRDLNLAKDLDLKETLRWAFDFALGKDLDLKETYNWPKET